MNNIIPLNYVNFILGIMLGLFLMTVIMVIIYCFSEDNDVFGSRFVIILKFNSILIIITILVYMAYATF